jgi:DNA-binding response OmpR family regulator
MSDSAAGPSTGATGSTILVVDDDFEIAALVKDTLEARGHTIVHVADGAALKDKLNEGFEPDLVLLDLMLPDADGLVLCADLNDRSDVPIIIVSGTTRKRDSILGFKLGADDFLAKPFHVEELEARVEAVLRRAAQRRAEGQPRTEEHPTFQTARALPPRAAPVTVGLLTMDDARRQVRVDDHLVELTPTEYRLLAILVARLDEVLSRQELSSLVWGYQDASIGRSIDVHVHRLRTKLNIPADRGPHIVSVRGFGYKMVPGPDAAAASHGGA